MGQSLGSVKIDSGKPEKKSVLDIYVRIKEAPMQVPMFQMRLEGTDKWIDVAFVNSNCNSTGSSAIVYVKTPNSMSHKVLTYELEDGNLRFNGVNV